MVRATRQDLNMACFSNDPFSQLKTEGIDGSPLRYTHKQTLAKAPSFRKGLPPFTFNLLLFTRSLPYHRQQHFELLDRRQRVRFVGGHDDRVPAF